MSIMHRDRIAVDREKNDVFTELTTGLHWKEYRETDIDEEFEQSLGSDGGHQIDSTVKE